MPNYLAQDALDNHVCLYSMYASLAKIELKVSGYSPQHTHTHTRYRRVYFDNHQLCYFNDGINGKPCLLYDLGLIRSHMKIWAVLLYHGHIVRLVECL